jgi:hypothetical protein
VGRSLPSFRNYVFGSQMELTVFYIHFEIPLHRWIRVWLLWFGLMVLFSTFVSVIVLHLPTHFHNFYDTRDLQKVSALFILQLIY